MEIIDKVQKAANALDDKKAKDIVILDIAELTSLGDYFVICSCSSTVQVKACADEVDEQLAKCGYNVIHREGYDTGNWILLDYGDIIVHVMLEESREFYAIERLWTDATRVDVKIDNDRLPQ